MTSPGLTATRDGRPPHARRHGRRRPVPYLACLAVVFPLVLLWSLATPTMAVVDDGAHIAGAAAVVRGQFRPPQANDGSGTDVLRVPSGLAALFGVADCLYQGSDTVPTCGHPQAEPGGDIAVHTTTGRYPPLYYLLIGWPTLLLHGEAAYWAVTIAAGVVNSLLLAFGLWLLLRHGPSRLAALGWVVAVTPEALYLAGSANDSGFEIAAAVAAWSGLLCVARSDRPSPSLLAGTAAATATLVLARPASPAWALLAVAVAAVVAGPSRLRRLSKQRAVLAAAAGVVAAGLLAVVYRLVVGAPALQPVPTNLRHRSVIGGFDIALGYLPTLFRNEVGGFLVTVLPVLPFAAWTAVALAILTGGLVTAPKRVVAVAVALVAAAVAVPVVADMAEINRLGLWWQGRDGMPLVVGLPILAAVMLPPDIARTEAMQRTLRVGLALVAALQLWVFGWVLHRYTSGTAGPWNPAAYRWEPPGGAVLLDVLFLAAAVVAAVSVGRWCRDRPGARLAVAEVP